MAARHPLAEETVTRILVTGGAGFIGSILTPMLVKAGYHVTVYDSFLYRASGANSLAELCSYPNFDIYRGDVRDWPSLAPHVAKADVVIPLAGLVGAPLCDLNPVDAELVNLRHPLKLFESLSREQLCIMPTTESSYGSNGDVCTEETKLNPLSTYANHKAIVEEALMERENSISLRLATVFGMSPRMRLDLLVNDFAWKAYKEGSILLFEEHFKRTVVHVRDVARAFQCALGSPSLNAGGLDAGIYNVGSLSVSKLELCEALKEKLGGRFYFTIGSTGRDPDQRNYVVSSAKLEATGFRFEVGLSDGLDELLKGYRAITNSIHSNV